MLTIRIPRCPVCKSPMLAIRQIGDAYCVSCEECGIHGSSKDNDSGGIAGMEQPFAWHAVCGNNNMADRIGG